MKYQLAAIVALCAITISPRAEELIGTLPWQEVNEPVVHYISPSMDGLMEIAKVMRPFDMIVLDFELTGKTVVLNSEGQAVIQPTHVPVPVPGDTPKEDVPPELDELPLPPVMAGDRPEPKVTTWDHDGFSLTIITPKNDDETDDEWEARHEADVRMMQEDFPPN